MFPLYPPHHDDDYSDDDDDYSDDDDDNAHERDPVFEPSVESCDQIMCYGRFQRHSLLLYVGGWRSKKG